MSQRPTLLSVTAIYVQNADGDQDKRDGDSQELTLSMTTCGDSPYLIVSTDRWAVDRPKELSRLVKQFAAQVEFLFDAHPGG
jgi:hypothetical protein